MKRYKVQWAYAVDIGSPAIHNSEAAAAGEVAHLLGTWIRRNLQDYLKRLREFPDQHVKFREALEYLVPQLQQLIGAGAVWEAYELWEDFYLQFENEFEMPLYVAIGTVIVEGSPQTGLRNRIPLLEKIEGPPIAKYGKDTTQVINRMETLKIEMLRELWEVVDRKADLKGMRIRPETFLKAAEAVERVISKQFHYMDEAAEAQYLALLREGILRSIFPKMSGMGLGAIRSWLVQYADFGGVRHAGRHTNVDRAKHQAKGYLKDLIYNLSRHADVEAHVGRNKKYAQEANRLIQHIHYLLDNEMVWAAYLDYKTFEEKWNHELGGHFPLQVAIGSMRVIPTPESE